MIDLQTFLLGLLMVSTITSLTTEAVKKIFAERNKTYRANTLAGIVAVVVSFVFGICYGLVTGTGFTAISAVNLFALMFMSWLCSMVGYDKVVQTIAQFKMDRKDD